MSINLQKGQSISLKKEAPGLEQIMFGLGWDINKNQSTGFLGIFNKPKSFDLDGSALCLDINGRINTKDNLIYFGNLRHNSGAITHLGDNLTGAGAGDDEQILVSLTSIPSKITKIVFTVNIYKAFEREQDFGQVNNAFVRLVDLANNKEIARYNLSGREYEGKTGMIMTEIYRVGDDWKMEAIGKGVKVNDLEGIIRYYS